MRQYQDDKPDSWFELTSQLTVMAARCESVEQVFNNVVEALSDFGCVSICLIVAKSKGPNQVFSTGFSKSFGQQVCCLFDTEHCIQKGIRGTGQQVCDSALASIFAEEGINAFCVWPLWAASRLVGILYLGSHLGTKAELPPNSFMDCFGSALAQNIVRVELVENFEQETNSVKWQKDLFEAVVQGTSEGMVLTDENGIVLIVNRVLERQLGISEKKLIGKKIENVHGQFTELLQHLGRRPETVEQYITVSSLYPEPTKTLRVNISNFEFESKVYWVWRFLDITSHVAIEEQLQNQESRYFSVINNTPLAIISCCPDGVITAVNDSVSGVLNVTKNESLLGKRIDTIPPLCHLGISEGLKNCLDSKQPYACTHDLSDENGDFSHIRVHYAPVTSKSGVTLGAQAIIEDTTEKTKTQHSLLKSEERYRVFFDNAPIPLWETNFAGVLKILEYQKNEAKANLGAHLERNPRIVSECLEAIVPSDVNIATTQLFDAKGKSQIQNFWHTLIPEDTLSKWAKFIVAIITGDYIAPFQTRFLTFGGKEIHVAVSAAIAPGHEMTLSKILISFQDITATQNATHLISTVFDSINSGVIVASSDCSILLKNKAAMSILQLDNTDDIINHKVDEFIPGAEMLLDCTQSCRRKEIALTLRDNQKHIIGYTSAVSESNQKIVVFTDLTQIIESAQKQKRSEQLAKMGMMIAKLSHDIKNPLTSILLGLSTLDENNQLSKEDGFLVSNILDEVRLLRELIGGLLDSVRFDALAPKPQDITAMMRICVNKQLPLASRKGISLKIREDLAFSEACVDVRAMTRVLGNLIQNALEACEAGDSITVGWRPLSVDEKKEKFPTFKNEVICFFVQDTGPGIPDEILGNLFVPFMTTKNDGTGLGLSVVKELVDAHGGVIEVTKSEVGTGFNVYLTVGERLTCKDVHGGDNGDCDECTIAADNCVIRQSHGEYACWTYEGDLPFSQKEKSEADCRFCEAFLQGNIAHHYTGAV